MKSIWLIALSLLSATVVSGAEKIVFTENFESPEVLKKYRIIRQENGAEFSVSGKGLLVKHKNVPQSGFLEIPVPMIKKGRLDFDVTVNAVSGDISNGIGLTLNLYNIGTFWHDACKDWRMYFPEPNSKRMLFYDIEPVGHYKIAGINASKKLHYRIRFDEAADMVEFYVGDMSDPAAARYDVSVFGAAFYQGGFLRIGSFGYAPTDYVTRISNLVLTEEIPDLSVKPERDLVLVFDGLCSEHYPVRKILAEEPAQKIRQYIFDSPGHSTPNVNNLQYFKLPGFETIARAKYIIFNDAPNLDEALQKKILAAVDDGAKLLIMGGFYSLNRGKFTNSKLGDALPVVMDKVWNLGGAADQPLELKSAKHKGTIFYYLDLKPSADAKVLMSAGNVPLLMQKPYGKGRITVFTGLISGPNVKDLYWKTPLVKEIFESGLK